MDLTEDEWVALSTVHFLYGHGGTPIGRLLTAGGEFGLPEVAGLLEFVRAVESNLPEPLVYYEHGRGTGTIRNGDRAFLDLIHRMGLHYEKTMARYVKGQKGKLAGYEKVVCRKGRNVSAKKPHVRPDSLADVAPLQSVLVKLKSSLDDAAARSLPLEVSLRDVYEYF